MIPRECRRLAEVDFPIAVVSKHSVREKSIKHGLPSMLHLWWARRPLAACRAVLMALLLPDPCDPNCPALFRNEARRALLDMKARPTAWSKLVQTNDGLRKALLAFIGDFANWGNSANHDYLKTSRALVRAAHPEETPLVMDPFAGGGSIPLEALRLGCEAFASDLNPVACLILKVTLEDIPRHGLDLADELRLVGADIRQHAERELAKFYPKDPDGATPIAYLWARTVKCESPNCGAEIPLIRSFWLCRKGNRNTALRYDVVRTPGRMPRVEFDIFEPETEKEVRNGTVTRAKAACLCCHTVLPPDRVRAQLAEHSGGADVIFDADGERIGGARLLAVVTLKPGEHGRHYRVASDRDYKAVWKAHDHLRAILDDWARGGKEGLCPVPDEPTPAGGGSGAGRAFSVQKYGMMTFGDLFTARQKVAMAALSRLTPGAGRIPREIPALLFGRCVDFHNSLSRWKPDAECPVQALARQAMPIVWDFAEAAPLSDATGSLSSQADRMSAAVSATYCSEQVGQVQLADAAASTLPVDSTGVWFTDPPYYDAIPYSDLSDFFFVWLKRTLPNHPLLRDPFDASNPLSPKACEAVQDEARVVNGRPKDRAFFEDTMARAFTEGRQVLREDGIGAVVFAHKTTEGWEALLSGMIRGGWTITASWPIATEMGSRLRARDSAALATSVHLVCRPRPDDAHVGDWSNVLRELPKRVGDWMERLQAEGVRGADLVFACIGPALEIFSQYCRVETTDGRSVELPEYLEKVWEVVGRTALEQILGTAEAKARNGAAGALEEDARLTALFLWTLQSTESGNGNSHGVASDDEHGSEDEEDEEGEPRKGRKKSKGMTLIFDVVRRFAQPLGIHLDEWEGRVIETEKGVVRLLPVRERARQLFGEEGAQAMADRVESTAGPIQLSMFAEEAAVPSIRTKRHGEGGGKEIADDQLRSRREATSLDRVHAAMLLQANGRSNALRALIKSEQGRGPDFVRLANALHALYPKDSEERRLLGAMLLAVPR